jgi:hypothetical protein
VYAARFKNRAQLRAVVQHGGQFDGKLRAHFTCCASAKVQMLTQKALLGAAPGRAGGACVCAAGGEPCLACQVLSLLTVLVQKKSKR